MQSVRNIIYYLIRSAVTYFITFLIKIDAIVVSRYGLMMIGTMFVHSKLIILTINRDFLRTKDFPRFRAVRVGTEKIIKPRHWL